MITGNTTVNGGTPWVKSKKGDYDDLWICNFENNKQCCKFGIIKQGTIEGIGIINQKRKNMKKSTIVEYDMFK